MYEGKYRSEAVTERTHDFATQTTHKAIRGYWKGKSVRIKGLLQTWNDLVLNVKEGARDFAQEKKKKKKTNIGHERIHFSAIQGVRMILHLQTQKHSGVSHNAFSWMKGSGDSYHDYSTGKWRVTLETTRDENFMRTSYVIPSNGKDHKVVSLW